MKIVACPNCKMRVIPRSDGACPSCQYLFSKKDILSKQRLSSNRGKSKAVSESKSTKRKIVRTEIGELKYLETASLSARFVNYSLDYIFLYLINWLFSFLFPKVKVISLFGISISLTFYFLYYFLFEYFLQKTPAKYITRTKIVMLDNSKPSSGLIVFRTLCRLIPFEIFSFIGSGSRVRTWWHDRWFNIRVIYD